MNVHIPSLTSLAILLLPLSALAQAEPSPRLLEVGLAAGAFMASPDHELYDSTSHQQVGLANVAPDIGLRLAFFPLSFLGAEAEGQFVPVPTISDRNTYVMGFRGHVMLQFPAQITPFVLAGAGTLGLSSGPDALGSDFDRAFHWGLGAKFWLNDRFTLRVDGRHIISGGRGAGDGNTSHFEATVGLGFALWRDEDPLDLDMDLDSPIRIVEVTPEVESETEPLPAPAVVEPVAAAIQVPEQIEIVEEVLDRVHFAWGSAVLRPHDQSHLDEAVVLLNRYPNLTVEVIGHTDSTGPYRYNLGLSKRRAEAVRDYLMAAGIHTARVAVVGAGPDVPLDSNATSKGRARNRRIEFTVKDEDAAKVRLRMREKDELAADTRGARP